MNHSDVEPQIAPPSADVELVDDHVVVGLGQGSRGGDSVGELDFVCRSEIGEHAEAEHPAVAVGDEAMLVGGQPEGKPFARRGESREGNPIIDLPFLRVDAGKRQHDEQEGEYFFS